MDIKPPVTSSIPLPLSNQTLIGGLELKINQLIQARVIDTQTLLNTLTMQLGEKTVSLQSNQPLNIAPGQIIELQVEKLQPSPEFKLLSPLPASGEPRLTLLAKADAKISTSVTAMTQPGNTTSAAEGQRFTATVLSVTAQKITLLPMPTISSQSNNASATATTATPAQAATTIDSLPPASKPMILDIKQLFVASSGTSAPQSATNTTPGLATNPNSPSYVPLKTTATLNLNPQMPVELQVLKTSPIPTFVISQATVDSAQTLLDVQKQLLPLQMPLQPLFQQLLQLANPSSVETGTVSEILQRLAQRILCDLPPRIALSESSQLRKLVDNSGLFLESKLLALLKQPPLPAEQLPLQDDLKFKLVKLAETIKLMLDNPTPNSSRADDLEQIDLELLTQSLTKTHGALAKLTLDQLNSLPKDETPRQSWIIELPFFNPPNIDSVLIEVEQDRVASSESKLKNWAVSITISPPDLGTIHCKLSCYDGSVNSRFWSESANTVEKINRHLDYLKQQFELKGLSAGFMEAHQGKPATTSQKQPSATLLSVKA